MSALPMDTIALFIAICLAFPNPIPASDGVNHTNQSIPGYCSQLLVQNGSIANGTGAYLGTMALLACDVGFVPADGVTNFTCDALDEVHGNWSGLPACQLLDPQAAAENSCSPMCTGGLMCVNGTTCQYVMVHTPNLTSIFMQYVVQNFEVEVEYYDHVADEWFETRNFTYTDFPYRIPYRILMHVGHQGTYFRSRFNMYTPKRSTISLAYTGTPPTGYSVFTWPMFPVVGITITANDPLLATVTVSLPTVNPAANLRVQIGQARGGNNASSIVTSASTVALRNVTEGEFYFRVASTSSSSAAYSQKVFFHISYRDECLYRTHNYCDSNATCTNTVGSYNCICNAGFSGNGRSCQAIPGYCSPLLVQNGGIVNGIGAYLGTTALLACDVGFVPADGITKFTCNARNEVHGNWSGFPACQHVMVHTPNLTSIFMEYLVHNIEVEVEYYDQVADEWFETPNFTRTSITHIPYRILMHVGHQGTYFRSRVNMYTPKRYTISLAYTGTPPTGYSVFTWPMFPFVGITITANDPLLATVNVSLPTVNPAANLRVQIGRAGGGGSASLIFTSASTVALRNVTEGDFYFRVASTSSSSAAYSQKVFFHVSDRDECLHQTHNCDSKAMCTNTVGSYNCICNAGFSGNGRSCQDRDECLDQTHNCDSNATCTNTVGSYNCICNPGFSGNGRSCQAIRGYCSPLLVQNGGIANGIGAYLGTTALLACDVGFVPAGAITNFTCNALNEVQGNWSGLPACQRIRFCTHITVHAQTGPKVVIQVVSPNTVPYEAAKAMCAKEKMQLLAPELSWCATTDGSSPYSGYKAWLKFEGLPGERIVSNIGNVSMNTPTLYRAICFKVACFVPAIANGGSINEFILKDDQVHYTCNTGFSRPPGIDTTCLADGTLHEAPSCNLICTRVSGQTRTKVVIQAVSPNNVSYEVAKRMCADKHMQLLAPELSWCATTNGASPYKGYNAWLDFEGDLGERIVSIIGPVKMYNAKLFRAVCFRTLHNRG
ncbi:uncharacterized protein LOC135820596 [Sycon ciliatum]|uniref:uncharacterized protein LOC135820596 n=1 Tax=Sycon ciliatum TaxID=27933 RepID=UPI0031F69F0C